MKTMLRFACLACFFAFSGLLPGQALVHDALALQRCIVNKKFIADNTTEPPRRVYLAILRKHVAEDSLLTDVALINKIKSEEGNPFLSHYLSGASADADDGSKTNTAPKSNFANSLGGLNVTTIADGIAKFLVARAKEELNIAFFDRFQKELGKFKDLQVLFPETWNVLSTIGDQIYNYEEYFSALRSAFKKDLDNLLEHLNELIQKAPTNKISPKAKAICGEGIYLLTQLRQGTHPGKVLHGIAGHTTSLNTIDSRGNLTAGLTTTDLFSQSLRSPDPNRYWVPMDSLQSLDTDGFRIYLGLFYEKVKRANAIITFKVNGSPKTLQGLLKDFAAKIDSAEMAMEGYRGFVTLFLQQANTAEEAIQNLKGQKLSDENAGEFFQFFDASLGLIQQVLDLDSLPGLAALDPDSTLQKWFVTVGEVKDIFTEIHNKEYGSAIFSATNLLAVALGDSFVYRQQLLKYGNFMANIVTAQNSDEVQAAIEAVALPPGSSRIKKESPFSVAVNGYFGVQYLFERDTQDFSKLGGRVGIIAPVGLTVSKSFHPFCRKKAYGGSFSLFLSLIDVGAIASFRLKSNDTLAAEVHLADIFCPGANLVFGIPRVPVSVGIGYQANAMLRKVTNTTNTVASNPAWGFHATLAVDIPILSLYAKAQKIHTTPAEKKPKE